MRTYRPPITTFSSAQYPIVVVLLFPLLLEESAVVLLGALLYTHSFLSLPLPAVTLSGESTLSASLCLTSRATSRYCTNSYFRNRHLARI